jgi:serine/threonine-protein kinase
MGVEPPLLGRTIGGRFQIRGHIGEGAMASVFRGVDAQTGAEVAIKVMHPHLAQDRTFTGRFKREAQAASMVRHPNSVAIYAIGEENGAHYIAMELCPGKDLKETLREEGRLTDIRAARIVATVADALHAAHQLGVVHRDLKPENVMVDRDPHSGFDLVKVLDFGIAKLVDGPPKARASSPDGDSDPPPALTQFGVVVGTPAYMSPEQCRGQPLDGRSDLYTCGILLYQLVTGVLPFNSESPFELAGKQAFEPPPPPSTHLSSMDRDLEQLILRLLSKSPDERPQNAIELRDELTRWLERKQPKVGPPGGADVRGLGRTVPMNAVAASVSDYLRANPPPNQGPAAPFSPMGHESTGLGLRGPLDTAVDPSAPQREPFDTAIDASAQLIPQMPPVGGPDPRNAGPYGAPAGAPLPPIVIVKTEGWGALGVVCILLSLIVGVGVGAGVFHYLGGPLPFLP